MFSKEKEQLIDQFLLLSDNLQKAIISSNTQNKIKNIGGKYQLSEKNIDELSIEIEIVLIGSNNPKNFESDLEKTLSINSETVNEIVKEVDREIFSQVRDDLNKLYQEEDGTDEGGKIKEVVEREDVEEEEDEKSKILRDIENPEKVPDDIALNKKPVEKKIDGGVEEKNDENVYVIGQDMETKPSINTQPEDGVKKEEQKTIFEQKINAFYEAEKKKNEEEENNTQGEVKKDPYKEPFN